MKTLGLIWRILVGIKDFLVLCVLALFFIGLSALLSSAKPATVPNGAALVLAMDGALVDQASETSPFDAAAGNVAAEIQVRDVVHAIDHAAKDDRIKAIVLELDGFMGGGQANIATVDDALTRFRKSGKPVHAWATAYSDDSWLLAAAASKIWLNPMGGVIITGPGGSRLYFAKALEKLQVDVNVFRVGTYKSFVEPFTRTAGSPEAKAADQALVGSLWGSWLADAKRLRPKADVPAYIAQLPQRLGKFGGDSAKTALDAGLVDQLGSRDEFDAAMIELAGEDELSDWGHYTGVTLGDYLFATAKPLGERGDAVGVVYVTGNIVDGEAPRGTAGSATIRQALEEALAKNDDIKALVVRVDSGGGSVTASEEIRAALLAAKADGLPVIASFGPVAASGGYWVGTAADEIYAQPSTITGSIGVFAILPSFPRALADLGITSDGVKTTPYSGEPDVVAGLSPQVSQVLQMGVENTYRRFLTLVATSRKLPLAEVDRIAQGRVWAGTQAKELKLVDKFGGLDAAVAAAAAKAGLKGEIRVVDIEKPVPAWQRALEGLGATESEEQAARDPWARLVQASRLRLLTAAHDLGWLAAGKGATMQVLCVECSMAGSPRPTAARQTEGLAAKLVQSSR
ncbi:signal peptide peptidase SppA [Sandarakinorhabdus limnophila]|uniref:signal peptide peptidase SppA n=1 Tax=Sandarakinorhabdus limnophila TaxID=210512 RepID=UPI00235419A4|nr:signal peptide peptidase SppA [Sandarakinorhabdus limnophila]